MLEIKFLYYFCASFFTLYLLLLDASCYFIPSGYVPHRGRHDVIITRLFQNTLVLPAFQVQVLIRTGDSGSNPERALYRYILLVVND